MHQEKDNAIEILRIIAIWAVVLIHTTSASLAVSGFYHHNTPFTFFLNQSARFAVPLFFLISGYVLQLRYPKNVAIKTFYKKRFVKLATPYVVWSFIYYAIVAHAGIKAFVINSPTILLFGSGAEHLYFIPSIMLLYLLFPFIQRAMQRYSVTKYPYPYLIFSFIGVAFLFLDYYVSPLPLPDPLRIALLNVPLFLFGMVWAQQKGFQNIQTKFWKPFSLFIFLISFFLVNIEGHMLSQQGALLQYFLSQWRLSVFLYTICVFIYGTRILRKIDIKIPSFFSSVTFFIFFIHVIFIHVFWKIWGAYLFSKSMGHIVEQLWFDPLVFLFVICCSYLSAFLVSKIPLVKNIAGIA